MHAPVYLDCNATTPLEPRVREAMMPFWDEEFGNAGSRTHDFGNRAKIAVQRARDQVASVVGAQRDEIVFTSGATESNNLTILGLRELAIREGKRHVITSAIEHKAVLEPCQELERSGITVTYLKPDKSGIVRAEAVQEALRSDTMLVSLMHVNNETGAIQPISDYCRVLEKHGAFFHVDAAQSFGKLTEELRSPLIHLISISAHKICGPKGIGALVSRRRGLGRVPLQPLFFGGGQERGLRPGTLPVPLIVGFGLAAELAAKENKRRLAYYKNVRNAALTALIKVGGTPTLSDESSIASTLSISFPGIDSEGLMVAAKELVAISNGAACTSQNYKESHVLAAMGLPPEVIHSTVRISWCHLTPDVNWDTLANVIRQLR